MTTHATTAKSEAFTVVWIVLSGTHTVKNEMQTTLILNTRQKMTTPVTSSIELNGVGGGFAGEGIKDKTRQARRYMVWCAAAFCGYNSSRSV